MNINFKKSIVWSCTLAAAFALSACGGDSSSTSPSNQEQQENGTVSSSSGSTGSDNSGKNSSSSVGGIESEFVTKNEALGLPSYYGECGLPVSWSSLDTNSTPTPESSSSISWSTDEKYRFDPTGTFCDRLDIMNQDTWNYAYRYTDDNGRDTTTSYISYRINRECLIEVSQGIFTASPSQHIKQAGIYSAVTISHSACLQDECMSVMDIAASFNTIRQACLKTAEKENIELFSSFNEIPIDTSIYVDEATYRCEQFQICGDETAF